MEIVENIFFSLKGCVFDLPSTYDSLIEERWQNGTYDSLIVASELPELLETSFPPRSRSNGDSRPWKNNGDSKPWRNNGDSKPWRNNGDSKPWRNNRTGVTSRYAKARSSLYEDDEDSSDEQNPYANFDLRDESNRKFYPSSKSNSRFQGRDNTDDF